MAFCGVKWSSLGGFVEYIVNLSSFTWNQIYMTCILYCHCNFSLREKKMKTLAVCQRECVFTVTP